VASITKVPLDVLATAFLHPAVSLDSLFSFTQGWRHYKTRSKTFRQPRMLNTGLNFAEFVVGFSDKPAATDLERSGATTGVQLLAVEVGGDTGLSPQSSS